MSNRVYLNELNESLMMLDTFYAATDSLSQLNANVRVIFFKSTNMVIYYTEKIKKDSDYRLQVLIWLAEWIRRQSSDLSGFTLRYLDYAYQCDVII